MHEKKKNTAGQDPPWHTDCGRKNVTKEALVKINRWRVAVLSAVILSLSVGLSHAADVQALGAKPDGKTLCTAAIQKAIDDTAAAGGGTVTLPPGTWLSGTLRLKSHVRLHLEAGATLLGSTDLKDYPEIVPAVRSYTDNYVNRSLIAGEDLDDVALTGRGTIDGNGAAYPGKQYLNRPFVIRLVNCRDVLVEGLRLRASPMWMQEYLACDRVRIRGLTVFNHSPNVYNNDGLDIDGCRDVTVSDCVIDSDDDGICLKSTLDRPCENVTVTNCVISSHCNAFKTGTESTGGFKNIVFSNSAIFSPRYSKNVCGTLRGHAGIALESVDGGVLDGVAVSNVTIEGVNVPIFLRLGNRARPFKKGAPKPGPSTLRNVSISHIVARGMGGIGCAIAGLPGNRIENVSLTDIQLAFEGGGKAEDASRAIEERPEAYPESRMFGDLPAYGFYVRHAKGVKFSNVRVVTDKPDSRHAVVFDDAADVVLDGLDAAWSPGAAALLRMTGVDGALVRGCRPQAAGGTFLKAEGATKRIALLANDFRDVAKSFEAPAGAVAEQGNLTK